MSKPSILPLETYALALAHLLRRRNEHPAAVLEAIHVSPEAFWQGEQHWNEQIANSFDKRRGVLAMQFASALGKARADIGLLDPRSKETPFIARAAPPAAGSAEVPSYLLAGPPAPAPPAPAPKPADLPRGTMLAFDLGPQPAAPLPFVPGAATETLPSSAPTEPARGAPPAGSGTSLLPDGFPGVAAIPWEAQPGGPEAAHLPPTPTMSVEHYAALVAELARHPPDPAAILARYGVQNAEEHQRLEATFKAHFAANAPLRAKYDALIARFASMMGG
jgi:hypothetical protein